MKTHIFKLALLFSLTILMACTSTQPSATGSTQSPVTSSIQPLAGSVDSKADTVRPVDTDYDQGDSFAAASDRIYVAEDDGGVIHVYTVSSGGDHFAQYKSTSFDEGDSIAVYSESADTYLYIAEDDGGRVDVYQIVDDGQHLKLFQSFGTSYDKNDRIAAGGGNLYVAEDDGGKVDIYDAMSGQPKGSFNTTFDRGDSIAAYGVLFLVAEDDGGKIQVLNEAQKWHVMGEFDTVYDKGDGIGTYMLSDNVSCR
jgi:outer membrane protein assembly factor BamB